MYANLLVLVELEELEQQLCHGDAFRKELLQGGDGDGQEQQQEQQVKAEIHSHSHYYLVQVWLWLWWFPNRVKDTQI